MNHHEINVEDLPTVNHNGEQVIELHLNANGEPILPNGEVVRLAAARPLDHYEQELQKVLQDTREKNFGGQRYSYKDVKENIRQQQFDNLFGPSMSGNSTLIKDISMDPNLMIRAASQALNNINTGPLQNAGLDVQKQVREYMFKELTAKIGNAALGDLHSKRYVKHTFDDDVKRYKYALHPIDLSTSSKEVARQVLWDYYRVENLRHPESMRNNLVRRLLQKAIAGTEKVLRLCDHDRNMIQSDLRLFQYQYNKGENLEANAEMIQLLTSKIENSVHRNIYYEELKERLEEYYNELNSSETLHRETRERALERQRSELVSTEAANRARKRTQVTLPEWGTQMEMNINNKKTLIQQVQLQERGDNVYEGEPYESDEKCRKYLKACKSIINFNLTPQASFDVMMALCKPYGPCYNAWLHAEQAVVREEKDAYEIFAKVWFSIQTWSSVPANRDRIKKAIVSAILISPPKHVTELAAWGQGKMHALVRDLHDNLDDDLAKIYIKKDMEDIMKAVIHIWYYKNSIYILQEYDRHYRYWVQTNEDASPRDSWQYLETWQFFNNSTGGEIPKEASPTFGMQNDWVSLCQHRYQELISQKRRQEAAGKGLASRRPPPDVRRPPIAKVHELGATLDKLHLPQDKPSREYLAINEAVADRTPATGDTSGRSTPSNFFKRAFPTWQRTLGSGKCHKCGSTDHAANRCAKYGYRSRVVREKCDNCGWHHQGDCLDSLNPRQARVHAVEAETPGIRSYDLSALAREEEERERAQDTVELADLYESDEEEDQLDEYEGNPIGNREVADSHQYHDTYHDEH